MAKKQTFADKLHSRTQVADCPVCNSDVQFVKHVKAVKADNGAWKYRTRMTTKKRSTPDGLSDWFLDLTEISKPSRTREGFLVDRGTQQGLCNQTQTRILCPTRATAAHTPPVAHSL